MYISPKRIPMIGRINIPTSGPSNPKGPASVNLTHSPGKLWVFQPRAPVSDASDVSNPPSRSCHMTQDYHQNPLYRSTDLYFYVYTTTYPRASLYDMYIYIYICTVYIYLHTHMTTNLPLVPQRSSLFFPKSWRSSRRLRKGVLQRDVRMFHGSSHGCQVLGNEEKLVEYNSHASRCHDMGGKADGRSLHGENYSAILEWSEIVILLGVTKRGAMGSEAAWTVMMPNVKTGRGGSRATLGFNQSWWILTSLPGIAGNLCFQWSNTHNVEHRVL